MAPFTPSAKAVPIFAIDDNSNQHLVVFDSAAPNFISSIPISGLPANEKLIGIDFRVSASGLNQSALYGVGSFGRIYTVNPGTGAATFVAAITDGVNPIILNGTEFGVDFNPQADRLRVVSDLDQNLRINVDTGVTIVDSPLNPGNSQRHQRRLRPQRPERRHADDALRHRHLQQPARPHRRRRTARRRPTPARSPRSAR